VSVLLRKAVVSMLVAAVCSTCVVAFAAETAQSDTQQAPAIESKGATECCCGITYYETKSEHQGTCGVCTTGSGWPGLYFVTYERVCAVCYGCGSWYLKSASCVSCGG